MAYCLILFGSLFVFNFSSWLRNKLSRYFRTAQRARHQRKNTALRLETLEDRLTPTTLPAGFSEVTFAGGITAPTAMEFAPDGRLAADNASLVALAARMLSESGLPA